MVIAHADQHAAVTIGAVPVALAQAVDGLVQPGPFAIPHAKYTVEGAVVVVVGLLRTPHRSHGQVFVDAGPEGDVVVWQQFARAPELFINGCHG